jgi:hypothetical protein
LCELDHEVEVMGEIVVKEENRLPGEQFQMQQRPRRHALKGQLVQVHYPLETD